MPYMIWQDPLQGGASRPRDEGRITGVAERHLAPQVLALVVAGAVAVRHLLAVDQVPGQRAAAARPAVAAPALDGRRHVHGQRQPAPRRRSARSPARTQGTGSRRTPCGSGGAATACGAPRHMRVAGERRTAPRFAEQSQTPARTQTGTKPEQQRTKSFGRPESMLER